MKIRHWDAFLFVLTYHILILALLPAFISVFSWEAIAFFFITYMIGGLSITAGYHRLYAHKAFSAHPIYEWSVLIGSTLALEMSALMWSHDHRIHHNHVDTEKDPYSIKKGFWYAHILWIFHYERNYDKSLVTDLLKNPRVVFQHKYYIGLAIGINLGVFFIGWALIGPLASFYAGFLLRLAMIHHNTWFINSLCHTIGSKTYVRELSAVDNALLAFFTFGEGYHNYHHAFAADYRNGIRWYHFDPTKWIIWVASKLGLAENLRAINSIKIQKTLVLKDKNLILEHMNEEIDEIAIEMKTKLEKLATSFEITASTLIAKINELKQATHEARAKINDEIKTLRAELKQNWKEWIVLTRMATKRYAIAH